MRVILTFFLTCYFLGSLSAQFFDDFSDGNLSNNPTWQGDTQNFIVANEELQLNAPDAGTSLLYTTTDFPDSIRWTIDFLMDFAPSASNKQRIYLGIDNIDLAVANGYYIEIGENGSDDALRFYRMENGEGNNVASGTLGSVGSDPAYASMMIEKSNDDHWSFYVAYEENDFKELDFEYTDPSFILTSPGFFALEPSYTSSRTESFFYDDISLELLLPDGVAPQFLSAELLDENSIKVIFDEPLDMLSATDPNNFELDVLGNPADVIFNSSEANVLSLEFGANLESGTIYTLSISGVKDVAGNEMISVSDIELFLSQPALKGDLLVSEILFDPYPDESDFVEIYNQSDKFILLDGLILSNDTKSNDIEILNTNLILKPQEYLAISPNIDALIERYNPPVDANFLKHDIPSLNNESGNISIDNIVDGIKLSIDSMDYHEDIHYILLDDTEGVSLERLSFELDSNDPSNLYSAAANVNYATPGYANSQKINPIDPSADDVTLLNQRFSPNQDGEEDLLSIQFNLEKPGYLADIKIFDVNGFHVKLLKESELLSQKGLMTWDGLTDDNSIAPVGMYIISYNFFHPDGEVKEGKLVAVLADYL